MIDAAVRRVQQRLEELEARERRDGVPFSERSRAIPPTTGRFLFALVAPNAGCEILEIGASRGYSTTWLAAGARIVGGHVTSLELNPRKCADWRRAIEEAGLSEWADLVEGDAFETLPAMDDVFDVVFLDADKDDYEELFALAQAHVEPGGVIVADNVLSHERTLGAYTKARQSDPRLSSVTVPLDRGLEVTVVLG